MLLRSKKKYCYFILLITVWGNILLAQTSFTATVSPNSVGKNETAELKLIVDNALQVEEITPPSLKDFIIISGPNQESGMESTNGVTRQYIGLTYLLKPKSAGKFTIASAVARADGKTYKSNPVMLEVTKNSSGNMSNNSNPLFGGFSPFSAPEAPAAFNDYIIKKGENVADKINRNIFIKVAVSKPSCYVGEPVIVTYKLYTRLKSESSITRNPSFNGFSVIDLLPPGNNYYSVEKLNGREYNVYTLRKSQLYPLQAGPVELEIAEVDNNIHFIKDEYLRQQQDGLDGMFRDFAQTTIPAEGMQDEKATLQSKPSLITVKPLPETGKPSFFKGAVGNFFIEAALDKNSFTTDDAGKLNVTISGAGNMTMIIAPDISWPDGIESYEGLSKEQLNKAVVPVTGTKTFQYPFTAGKPGIYNIPSIVFSFFDVKEGLYKTVNTQPVTVTVTKGVGKEPIIRNNNIAKTGREQFFDALFTNRWLIVVPLAILIITGIFVWLRKENKKAAAVPVLKTSAAMDTPDTDKSPVIHVHINPLNLTEEKLAQQDPRAFYETLNNELRKFLSDKLGLPLATINKKSIAEEADKKGVALHTTLQIQRLLDNIEWQLYTPFAAEDKMLDMYNNATDIVHALNVTNA